ncbi:AraC family transcriptional regulator [Mameliella alba]|uniref:AraC family transcriptional regulator n=1 Tax=Mameliella alba TaxID=561184 RepID=UPI000888419F|nr:AraC family transcriptional regulator [Mameliella alba]MBY6118036.1 AraC family transcriptional regulator [Mameliella alba]OWV42199.1 AraC family transcriptional regulator [Mameliella alba]OWV47323.1 AraC family transcriptional regulator [Mameliella alba]PTR38868.1 AraC family transcriptional regulator [Mameliella alba]SDD45758.1 AraC family transcriptional regulator [Mameliella alba]
MTRQDHPAATYEARIRRVMRHIVDRPDGDLSLDALADVAAMSRFHFHRVYAAMTGETVAQAVRRLRLHRAGKWLVQGGDPVEVIAARVGYANAQSFNRAFKAHYGITPLAFRAAGQADRMTLTLRKGDPAMYPVEIRNCAPARLAALPHKGDYHQIARAFTELAAIFSARGLWPQARGMAAIYYDSPADTPEPDLRSAAGILVEQDFAMPEDLQDIPLPDGDHLVLTFKGAYAGLPAAWDHAYGVALPDSGRMPADSPSFEVYLNDPTDTPPEALLTEIHVPLLG